MLGENPPWMSGFAYHELIALPALFSRETAGPKTNEDATPESLGSLKESNHKTSLAAKHPDSQNA